MTTEDVYAALQHTIDPNSMSQTVQDAITVTRKLGIRYLWVDALCIIQDSNSDKANEIREMGNVYKMQQSLLLYNREARTQDFLLTSRARGANFQSASPTER